jgi:hypothetical protein
MARAPQARSRGHQQQCARRTGEAPAPRRTVVTAALLDATTALLDATTALAAHVDSAVDFTNRDSVQTNADLVRECLNEIRDDADRNLSTPARRYPRRPPPCHLPR